MEFNIKPLSPELLNDYLYFFDNAVFAENPEWSKCYCFSYHFVGTNEEWSRERNRASVIDYIKENRMTGYLAYADNKPVGWCNANNRLNFERLVKYYDLIDNAEDKVCSIVCFLINPDYRRKGIAQKMLEQICIDYTKRNFDYIEAYPGKGKLSCEAQYKGPLEMYMKMDFKIERENDDYFVVRKWIR